MKKISVVIPMYYEEEVAQECYSKMTQVLSNIKDYEYEIICVNDGSKDKTLSILENNLNMSWNMAKSLLLRLECIIKWMKIIKWHALMNQL